MFDALIVSLSLLSSAPDADDPPAASDPPAAEAPEAALPMHWLTLADHVPGELATRKGHAALAATDDVLLVSTPVVAADGSTRNIVTAHEGATGAVIAQMVGAPPLDGDVRIVMNGMDLATNGAVCAVVERFINGTSLVGRVHLHDVGTGAWRATLESSAPERDFGYGSSIAMDDDVVVVRAMANPTVPPNDEIAMRTEIFEVATGARRFVVPDPLPGQRRDMGASHVALHDGIAVVGHPSAMTDRPAPGAVYLLDVATGEVVETILPPAEQTVRGFGTAVAMNERYVVIGALQTGSWKQSHAYVYDRAERALWMIHAPEPDVPYGAWISILDEHHAIIGAENATRGGIMLAGNAWVIDLRSGRAVGPAIGLHAEVWSQQYLGRFHQVTETSVILSATPNLAGLRANERNVPYLESFLVVERAALLPPPE